MKRRRLGTRGAPIECGQCAGELRDDVGAGFDFDEEALVAGDGGEDFFEGGNFFAAPAGVFPLPGVEGAELSEGLPDDRTVVAGGFAGVEIVDDDEVVIAGEVNVNLDGIGLLAPGEADGCKGVLRSIEGSAAMGDDFHGADKRERQNAKGIRRKDAKKNDFVCE